MYQLTSAPSEVSNDSIYRLSGVLSMFVVKLHKELADALSRRDQWRQKDQETPQDEKDRLLKQVKEDNQEIASLERQ